MKIGECVVAIICTAYNHEPYIRKCLEGFVVQKTNFSFVAIVHDDASNDKTASIIREFEDKYPDIIVPIYEVENQYSKHDGQLHAIIERELNRISPKYIAICEGDDYWDDPYKLQKQVDTMEADKTISLCYTKSKSHSTTQNEFVKVRHTKCRDFRTFLLYDETITLTALMKYDQYKAYYADIQPEKRNWLMGDTPLWLWLSKNGTIAPLDIITGVYNAHEGSVSRSGAYRDRVRFNKSALDIRLFFVDKYNDCHDLVPYLYDTYYRSNMNDAYRFGETVECWKNFFKIDHKVKSDYIAVIRLIPRNVYRLIFNK